MKLANEAARTRNPLAPLEYSQEKIDRTARGDDPYLYPANDWYSMLMKKVTTNQRLNMNISGGGNVARYYIAGTLNMDNGNLKVDKRNNFNSNINLKTYQVRSNININLSKSTEGVVRMSEEQLEESRLKLRQTVKQEALGLKSRADVVQVEAEVATNDAALTGSRNNLTNYLTLLKTKMNYPLNDTLRIDTQVDLLAQEMSETAESIYFDARRQNPTAKIADFNLRQSRLRYSIAKGNYYPSLSISGGYQTNYFIADMDHTDQSPSFKNQFRDNRGEYIQASLSIPIFNSLSRRTNVNRSRNNMLIQEQNRNQTLQQLQSDIRKAVDDCQGYAKQYEQMKKRVEANQLAYDVMRRKYEEGLVSPLDLQTSANLLLSAKADQLKTKLDYIIQCRLVKYYKGIPLIEQLQ